MIRGRVRAATLAVSIAPLLAGTAEAARLDFTVDLGVEHNDNLNFSAIDPREDTIYRPGFGFVFSEDAEKLRANVAGRAEYRHYADGTYDSGVDGEVTGRIDWLAIPERLTFTAEDTLALEAIDTFEADSPDNRQQVNVLSVGPTVNFRMGEALDGQVDLRLVDSEAEVTDEFNSSRVDLALRTTRHIDATSRLSFNLRGQAVDFDDEVTGRNYKRSDLFARYEKQLNRFEAGLDAGYSHIDYSDGRGSRSEPLLRGDLTWNRNDNDRWSVAVSNQFSDAATDAMEQLDEGTSSPGSILTGDTVINASPFKEQRASLDYSHTSTLITVSIEAYAHKLDYLESDEFDQEGRGARGTLLWVLNPLTMAGAFAGLDRIEYRQLEREDQVVRYGVNLSRTFTAHWSARLELSRYERETTVPGTDAAQNAIFLVFRYTR